MGMFDDLVPATATPAPPVATAHADAPQGAAGMFDDLVPQKPKIDSPEYVDYIAKKHKIAPDFAKGLVQSQTATSAVEGIPILGGLAHQAGAGASALAQPLTGAGASGGSIGERYTKNKAIEDEIANDFAAEHPHLKLASELIGGAASTGLAAGTAVGAKALGLGGETLLGQAARGAASGAGIGGADAAVRGNDVQSGVALGAGTGAAFPVVGRAIGAAIQGARNLRQPPPIPANEVNIAGVNVPRTMGEATGDFDTIRMEQAALRGGTSQREQQVAQDFYDKRGAKLDDASEAIARRLDPSAQMIADNPQAAGDIVSQGIGAKAAEAKRGYQQLYDEFGGLPGEFESGAFTGAGQDIKGALAKDSVIVNPVTTKVAAAMVDHIDSGIGQLRVTDLATGQPAANDIIGINLKGVDQARKELLFMAQGAERGSADARAARAVINEFDNHVQGSIEKGLFSGSDRALEALKEARAGYSQYRKTFTSQGGSDDVGRAMERIVGGANRPPATPTETANFLYGNANVGASGLSVRLAQRLKGVLGEGSQDWSAVRQGLWSRLTQPAEGRTGWGPQKVSERISEFLNGNGRPLSHVMLTESERGLMEEYAKLLKQLVPPPGSVNYSNTAPTLIRLMKGGIDGIFSVGGFHIGGPAGVLAGVAAHKVQTAMQDAIKASRVARSLYGTQQSAAAEDRLKRSLADLASLTARGSMPAMAQ